MRSIFLKRFSTLRVCRIRSLIRSQASVKIASLTGGGGRSGLGLLALNSRRICPETRFDLASGNGAILGGYCQGYCGCDLVGTPFGLLRSREGERLSLVGSGIWSMMAGVQCGSDFATFERVEHKVELLLLCRPFLVVSVCAEEVVSLLFEG